MPKKALQTHLSQLREELAGTEEIDTATRQLLSKVAEDIEQVLDEEASNHASVRERLESAAYRFEAEYPRLAGILGDISDTLAKLGI